MDSYFCEAIKINIYLNMFLSNSMHTFETKNILLESITTFPLKCLSFKKL